MLTLILVHTALASECTSKTASTNQDLSAVLAAGVQAFADMDEEMFKMASADADTFLVCLQEPVDPLVAAAYFRLKAMSAFFEDDLVVAQELFLASHRLDPAFSYLEDLIPPGHALLEPFESALVLALPQGSTLEGALVDGSPNGVRVRTLPTILQTTLGDSVNGTEFIPAQTP